MTLAVLALVLTVFMGGVLAYNGDVMGRRYGKKRVSIFGLRPKHTAILVTSVTGILISALTTGTLFLIVKPVRDVILNGEDAIRNSKLLERNIESQKQQAEILNRNLVLKTAELERSRQVVSEARVEAQRLQASVESERAELNRVQNALLVNQARLSV